MSTWILISLYLGSLLLSLAGLGYAILWLRRSARALREASSLASDRAADLDRMQKASRVSALEARAAWVEASAALSEAQLIRWLDASQPAKDAMLKVEVRLFRSMRYLETQLSREPSVLLCPEVTTGPLTPADDQDAKLIMLAPRTRVIQGKANVPVRIAATRASLPRLLKAP